MKAKSQVLTYPAMSQLSTLLVKTFPDHRRTNWFIKQQNALAGYGLSQVELESIYSTCFEVNKWLKKRKIDLDIGKDKDQKAVASLFKAEVVFKETADKEVIKVGRTRYKSAHHKKVLQYKTAGGLGYIINCKDHKQLLIIDSTPKDLDSYIASQKFISDMNITRAKQTVELTLPNVSLRMLEDFTKKFNLKSRATGDLALEEVSCITYFDLDEKGAKAKQAAVAKITKSKPIKLPKIEISDKFIAIMINKKKELEFAVLCDKDVWIKA